MDGKDFQKHQRTSKSSRASLSIAIILGESVSQLLAMEKSCGSQQRVCFSEKNEMMGVFSPKRMLELPFECKAITCPKGDAEHRGHKNVSITLAYLLNSFPQLSRSKFLLKFTTTDSESTGT